MRILLLALGVSLFVTRGEACAATPAPDTPAPSTDDPNPTDPPTPDPGPQNCGGDLGLESIDATGYGDGGPVETADKLKFNAGSASSACWKNHETPADQLDFGYVADGGKLSSCNSGSASPGPAIVHYSPDGSGGDQALWHSCSVLCSKEAPEITVQGSASPGVTLEACIADSFEQPNLRDCTPVSFGSPTKIGSAEKPTLYDIVLKASNFGPNTFAAVQSADVTFEKCDEPAAGPNCDGACEFKNGDSCGYSKDSSNVGDTELKVYDQKTIVGNLDSGVNAKLDANPSASYPDVADAGFLASPQNPGDKVVVSKDVDIQAAQDMHFEVYDACDGNSAKVCFDTPTNCPYSSNQGVALSDRQWKKEKVAVPAGTKKIFLVGDNTGNKFCATGFSHINFSEPGGEPACNK